jgi:SAM-dependent methyltransferase
MHPNSLLLFRRDAKPYFKDGLRVLEIGPSFPSPFRQEVADRAIQWETLDIYQSPDLTYSTTDPYHFPIPDETFDIVFSAQVIEHVASIWRWIPELTRVTKMGGRVITINPVNWGFHEHPVDCWRMYPDGMKALYQDAGLEVELSNSGSLENFWSLFSERGVKWVLRPLLGRTNGGEPLFPIDTVTVGIRKPTSRPPVLACSRASVATADA